MTQSVPSRTQQHAHRALLSPNAFNPTSPRRQPLHERPSSGPATERPTPQFTATPPQHNPLTRYSQQLPILSSIQMSPYLNSMAERFVRQRKRSAKESKSKSVSRERFLARFLPTTTNAVRKQSPSGSRIRNSEFTRFISFFHQYGPMETFFLRFFSSVGAGRGSRLAPRGFHFGQLG
jgi:hypothetical protein